MNRNIAVFAAILGALLPCYTAAAAAERPRYQAVWVDAFHDGFKSPEQTRRLIEWARRNYVNALFIEVRKTGDAYYPSKIEPVGSDISPAGYDPLADLIAQAHDTRGGKSRIEIHAWLIVYRVSPGGSLPAEHVLRKHPGWIGQTYSGATRDEDKNVYLDPGVPEVITHTDRIVADLVQRYDLDGIHFDRIRYPGRQWGYNPIAVARYRSLSGGVAGRLFRPRPDDAAWGEFRRQQVSMMLRRLYITTKAFRPTVKVSAATVAFDECKEDFKATRPYYDVFQDWQTWVRADLLDLNIPMIYKRDHVAAQARDYRQWLDFLAANRGTAIPVVGQGSFINSPAGTLRQIALAFQHTDLAGVCLFSYAQLVREGDRAETLMEGLRKTYFRPNVPTPAITPPDQMSTGWVAGVVGGDRIDYVAVTLETRPPRSTHTDGSGFFAFMRVPVGEYEVKAALSRGQKVAQKVRVSAGKVSVIRLAP
ncbi:MAG: family 10 glycosylhydrolase [Candidatus Sumerlaeia bacterium]|nr:family 10 glycosylhydrolase [Candidatus Sumerlaeia bacterium]